MTDKEKLDKIKKLADAMYYAAQYLTTDASGLRKAMDEYQKFIVYEYNKQKPESEDLEKAAERYARAEYNCKNPADLPDRCRCCYAPIKYAFKVGAQWQRERADDEGCD